MTGEYARNQLCLSPLDGQAEGSASWRVSLNRPGTVISAIGVAALTLSGCGPGDAAARKSAARKGELVVGVAADEFGLRMNRHRVGMYPLNVSACEAPFRLNSAMTSEPSLALRSEYRGANTFRVTLRSNVAFHDGTRLTAGAVEEMLQQGIVQRTQYSFLTKSSMKVVDDSTLDITPAVPNLRLIDQLVHPTYAVAAPGRDPARPVCTGPFRIVEYVPQNRITVERHDGYWGAKARLKRLTFRFIPDENTRALALRSGELDAIYDVNRGTVKSLEQTPGIRVVTSPPGSVMLMYITTRGSPPYTIMSDPHVRRAVAMALDRRLLAERVLGGYAAVVGTVNPPIALGPYANIVAGVPHDVSASARTLDSAGWRAGPDGFRSRRGRPLDLSLIYQAASVDRAVAEFVQYQLAQVGIRVRVEQLEPGAFESRLNSGRFDLDIEVPNQNDSNPAFLLALRWYSRSNVRSAPFMPAGVRFDSLVSASLSAPDRDDAQRLAADAMHELVDRQVAAIPLAGLFRIYALSERVRGFDPHPSRASQWWNNVSIEQ